MVPNLGSNVSKFVLKIIAVLFVIFIAVECSGTRAVFAQQPMTVAIVTGEDEYRTEETLPDFFKTNFPNQVKFFLLKPMKQDRNVFQGMEKVKTADVLVLSLHRRALPKGQLQIIKQFVKSKKPIIAIRTATHGFALRKNQALPKDRFQWKDFDRKVLGCHYKGHEPSKFKTGVTAKGECDLVDGVQPFVSKSWLYRVTPLSKKATILLQGKCENGVKQPVAWKLKRESGGTVICTTLGHPSDFQEGNFVTFLKNACASIKKRPTNQTTRRSDQKPEPGC